MSTNSAPDAEIAAQASTAPAVKPLLDGPKRQHFLPRFYLDGFTLDGMLAVYDRESNEVRVQQPLNTGVIGHFYTLEDAEGRKRFELEQMLSEYEGKASPVINKLCAKEDIDADERTDLAIFIALGAFRTPDIIDSLKKFNAGLVSDMAKSMFADVQQVMARMRGKPEAPANDDELEKEARLLVEVVQSDAYEVKTDHRWAVGMAMDMALTVAPIFAGRDWTVAHRENEKKSFITTDAPLMLTTLAKRQNSFWGVGFGNTDALVLFPLSQSCLLAMYGNSGKLTHTTAATENIRQVNLALTEKCQRFVIGRDAALVRSLADAIGLAAKAWRPKLQASR